MKWIFAALLVATWAWAAEPAKPGKSTQKAAVKPIEVKTPTNWQARSMKWFSGDLKDTKALRKQMRAATKALKQPCRYCHSRDFKSFQDNRLISQQMMALSAEHNVACADCHNGREGLTHFGKEAEEMFELSRREGVYCEHCHVKGKRFEVLNDAGKRREAKWKAARKGY